MLFSIVDINNDDITYLFEHKTKNTVIVDAIIEQNNKIRKEMDKFYKEENICYICYEERKPLLKLQNIIKYEKHCECNVYIHTNCLDTWFNINSTCPICIKIMNKKLDCINNINNINHINNINNINNKINKNIFAFINQNINIFINLLLLFYIIHYVYYFYFFLLETKNYNSIY